MTSMDQIIQLLNEIPWKGSEICDHDDEWFKKKMTCVIARLSEQQAPESLIVPMISALDRTTFMALASSCEKYTNFKSFERAKLLNARKDLTDLLLKWWRLQLKNKTNLNIEILLGAMKSIDRDIVPNHAPQWLILLNASSDLIDTVEFNRLIDAIDVHLQLKKNSPNSQTHERKMLELLDFPDFFILFVSVMQLADQIAKRMYEQFPMTSNVTRLMWLMRAYHANLSDASLDLLGDFKKDFNSEEAEYGLATAISVECELLKDEMWKKRLESYCYPFGTQVTGVTRSFLASRIALASIGYSSLVEICGDNGFACKLIKILWSTAPTSRDVRILLNKDVDPLRDIRIFYATHPSLNPITTEYTNAWEWRKKPVSKGVLVNTAKRYIGLPSRSDHKFVRAVFRELLRTKFENHAIIAIASKLHVFHGGSLEPQCTKPYSKSGVSTAAAYNVKRIELLVGAVVSSKWGETDLNHNVTTESQLDSPDKKWNVEKTELSLMAEEIYPTDNAQKKNGFDWINDSSDRSLLTSDLHLTELDRTGSHLWLLGKPFQEEVDNIILRMSNPDSPVDRQLQENSARFCRFLFLIPQCVPLNSTLESNILKDWPGHIPMLFFLNQIAKFRNNNVNLENDLFSPITKTGVGYVNLKKYFTPVSIGSQR